MKRILVAVLLLLSNTVMLSRVTDDFTDNAPQEEENITPQKQRVMKKKARSTLDEDFGEDSEIKVKMERAQKHVEAAVDFFSKTTLGQACRAFEKDARWFDGEFSIFIFGIDGTCYLFGNELLPLWENFYDIKGTEEKRGVTFLGEAFIDDMIEVGKDGGWVSYDWNYSSNYSYVKTVKNAGREYIVGTGFYPESPRFLIRQLVKRAVRYGVENGAADLFRQINNPIGEFVKGDGYLWAYDMKGNAFAHGRNLAIVGQNRLNWKDSSGRARNKVMIDLIKDQGSGWVDYDEFGIDKSSYADSFTDPKTGERYIVGGGYYPRIDDETIISFVKRGINYLKSEGAAIAFRDFSSQSGDFVQGPLRLFAYNLDGTVLADAQNPIFIGQNLMDVQDPEGKYMVREAIEKAKKFGKAWITFVDKRAYKSVYVELVEVPDGKYVVGAGFWPSSKEHTARSLAEKAAIFMENHSAVVALKQFSGTSSEFLRGDLFVSVYSERGICLAHGLDRDRIWFDETKVLDSKGYPIIERIIDSAKRGGGWVEHEHYGRTYRVFTKLVTKKLPYMQEGSMLAEELVEKRKRVTSKRPQKKAKTDESFILTVGYFK